MDASPISGVLILLILLCIKAIISNAKAAANNLNESVVKKKALEGDIDSQMLLELIDKPERYTYTIDVIITAISVLCGMVYARYFGRYIYNLFDISDNVENVLRIIIYFFGLGVMIVFVALFGSLIPKKLAKRNSEKKAYNMVHIMFLIMKVFRPITAFMQYTIKIVIKVLGIKPQELEDSVTEEEIISMVNEGHEQGVLEESEVQMISNIIEFDEKEVADVMTHRRKIVAIDSKMSFEEAYRMILKENYSRFPLFEDDIDNIIGIINMKDMARIFATGDYSDRKLSDIARKPHFVPETQNISVLFSDMKANKNHMAIVVDEYGQTSGIVAFEDVLEEIVGNIMDEYDVDEKFITRQANGTYLMRGLSSIDDVQKAIGIQIEEDEFDTLNGFLISLLGRIPDEGEKTSIEYKGMTFDILDVRNKIIRFVRVCQKH